MSNIKYKLNDLESKVQRNNPCIELVSSNNLKQIVALDDVIEILMANKGENLETQVNKIKNAKSIMDASAFEICLIQKSREIQDYPEYRKERAQFINDMASKKVNHGVSHGKD